MRDWRDKEITTTNRERAACPDPHRVTCPTCGAVPGAECTGGGERVVVSSRVRAAQLDAPRLVHGPRMERATGGMFAAPDATSGYLLDLLLEDASERGVGRCEHVTHRDGSRSRIEAFFVLHGNQYDGRPQVWGWRVVQLVRVGGSRYTTCGAVLLEHGLASNECDALDLGRKRAIALAKERRAASKRPDLPVSIQPINK